MTDLTKILEANVDELSSDQIKELFVQQQQALAKVAQLERFAQAGVAIDENGCLAITLANGRKLVKGPKNVIAILEKGKVIRDLIVQNFENLNWGRDASAIDIQNWISVLDKAVS